MITNPWRLPPDFGLAILSPTLKFNLKASTPVIFKADSIPLIFLIFPGANFKNLREREVIATAKLKGDIKYKPLGKFGDRNVIELMIVNGQRKAVAIRDFRRTAIILNIEEFEEMQKVMKRIKLP